MRTGYRGLDRTGVEVLVHAQTHDHMAVLGHGVDHIRKLRAVRVQLATIASLLAQRMLELGRMPALRKTHMHAWAVCDWRSREVANAAAEV